MNRRTFLKAFVTLGLAIVFPIKTCEAQSPPIPPPNSFGFPLKFPMVFPDKQMQKTNAVEVVNFRSENWLSRLLGIK